MVHIAGAAPLHLPRHMTARSLFVLISLAVLAQVAIALAIAFVRHWRAHGALLARVADLDPGMPEPLAAAAPHAAQPAWSGWRAFRVTRREVEDASASVVSLYLAPVDGRSLPRYAPGQFLTFCFELPDAEGKPHALVRCYSLSDRWQPDHYRVSIKRIVEPQAGVVSNHVHARVRAGDTLAVRAPAGHFVLDPGDAPVVLIAGGIGLTPVLAMLEDSLHEHPARTIWLFYAVRHGGEHAMKARLAALAAAHANFHLRVCYSRPRPEDAQGRDYDHVGHVDIALLRGMLPLLPFHFYLCGPGAMLAVLVPALEDWGVPRRHIHYETFGPSSLPPRAAAAAPAGAPALQVSFAKAARSLAWDPAAGSLLAFAEQHGIAIDSGCRAGGCGTCQTRIVSGEVAYAHQPDFDPAPGTCLMCIATPATDVVLDA